MANTVSGRNRPFLLFGAVASLVAILLVIPPGPEGQGIHEGDLAPRALVASHGAQYESQVLTDAVRDQAAGRVEDKYTQPDPAIAQQQVSKLRDLFDGLRALYSKTNLTLAQRVNEAQNVPGAQALSPTALFNILSLDRTGFDGFRDRAVGALTDVMVGPILPATASARIADYLAQNPAPIATATPSPSATPTATVTPASTTTPAGTPAASASPATTVDTTQGPLSEILRAFVVQNIQVDRVSTDQARAAARAQVSPVVSTYSAGQLIAEEGKRLDSADIEALRETGVLSSAFDAWRTLGVGALGVAFGLALAWFLFRRPGSARQRVALVPGFFTLALLVAARVALPELLPDRDQQFLAFALPIPAAAILAGAVCGRSIGITVAVLTGLFATFIAATYPDLAGSGFTGSLSGFELAAAYVVAGVAGATVASSSRRGWALLASGLAVALSVAGILVVFWTMSAPRANHELEWFGIVAGVSGVASVLLGGTVAAITARVLGIASPASLGRLAQTTHPLLRRLQNEAPGTYQHSLVVSTLAEGAAERIRADGLLAKVGALYHDVGKLTAPAMFIENSMEAGANPHQLLSPEASAASIHAHVTRGLEIARTYHVPAAVRDFIPQHHGTRLVMYFYSKALAGGGAVDREAYRYGGPKPQSREAAIVMLADSCEAIVRADPDHSTAQIARLVDSVVAERIAEGELDECGIALNDLRAVAASFKETLRAVYHPRVQYPVLAPEDLARVAAD